jgi:hypothetical protein
VLYLKQLAKQPSTQRTTVKNNFIVAPHYRFRLFKQSSSGVHMRGGTKVMPIFFSETIITIIMKLTYIMGTSFTNLRLFFHKVSFIINALLPPLHEMLYTGRVKLFAEASERFTHAVF